MTSTAAVRGSREGEAGDRLALVVPCYNEEQRLSLADFSAALARYDWLTLLFVDDGSTDRTKQVLEQFAAMHPGRVLVESLERNMGKAEAVRHGLRTAATHAPLTGFWDADLAAPLSEVAQLRHVLIRRSEVDWVLGVRLRSLGRAIERRELRHYLGRGFATVASKLLRLHAYDTQCGAKLFRSTGFLPGVLADPFLSRWIFDVEMLVRLRLLSEKSQHHIARLVYEQPLEEWKHKGGSKVKPTDFLRAFGELLAIRRRYTV